MTSGRVRISDSSANDAIRAATTLSALDAAEVVVLASDPVHFASRLGKLENERAKLLQAAGDQTESEIADWLAQMLWMIDGVNFGSRRVGGDTDPFSIPEKYPAAIFLRALDRGRDSSHPVARAVWLHALWCLRDQWKRRVVALGLPRFDVVARECAGAAADAADWHMQAMGELSEHGAMMSVLCWQAALEVAQSVRAIDLVTDFLSRAQTCLSWLVGLDDLWGIRLLACETNIYLDGDAMIRQLATSSRIDVMQATATALDAGVASKGFSLGYMREELVDVFAGIARLQGTPLSQQEIARRRAVIARLSAEAHPSPLVRATLWEEVAGEYQQAGDAKAAATAMEESRRAIEAAKADREFKVITSSGSVTKAQVLRAIGPFLDDVDSADEALGRASEYFFVPWYDDPHDRAIPRGFASQILPRVQIIGDRVQAPEAPATGSEPVAWEAREEVCRQMAMATGLMLQPFFAALNERFADVAGSLLSLFCASPSVAEGDVDLLARVFAGFVEDDPIEVLHLLPPRLEQMVHRTMRRRGASATTRPPSGGLQERTFGALIEQARASGAMPPDLADFIDATLTKEWGLNIRNNVAHGWLPAEAFNSLLATRLIHVGLVIWRWSFDAAPGPAASPSDHGEELRRA